MPFHGSTYSHCTDEWAGTSDSIQSKCGVTVEQDMAKGHTKKGRDHTGYITGPEPGRSRTGLDRYQFICRAGASPLLAFSRCTYAVITLKYVIISDKVPK